MLWNALKGLMLRFPKWALVVGVIVGSTAFFAFWWFTRSVKQAVYASRLTAPVEDVAPKLMAMEAHPERLLLVDDDLYDVETGTLLFKNWLRGAAPLALYYDAKARKIIARYEKGFVRYTLEGKEEARLLRPQPPVFSDDLHTMLEVREKDIWQAELDWKEWKIVNERQVTSIAQFNDTYFAQNLLLWPRTTLVVRNLNQLLRVNLDTGLVKPVRLPLGEIAKRRSPDHRCVVGLQNGEFYCYDVESDEAKTIPVGRRGTFTDYQWLDNDRCLCVASGKALVLYDRPKNALTELLVLPFPCRSIDAPSPDGRYVFCTEQGRALLVDVEKKTVLPVTGGSGVKWISNDTFAFAREVPDSELRGTWLQTAGEGEKRVSPEPYITDRIGGWILSLSDSELLVFATNQGLWKMKVVGSEVVETLMPSKPVAHVLGVQTWPLQLP